ncbi:hypothetical protein WCD74_01560 [Actinomycetospora sp. OC33-EN08]|uniref:Uncharacterized protein n=1 Tax=Actinomycetospora aurantiaca TaxID=3129233 RepID=A0ABU8MGH2_9PSEU
MSRFEVDPEMLGVAASRLEAYRHRLSDIGSRSAVGDLGSAHLVGVVHATEDPAAHDLQRVSDVLGGLTTFLRSAGTTYRGSDDSALACYTGGDR